MTIMHPVCTQSANVIREARAPDAVGRMGA